MHRALVKADRPSNLAGGELAVAVGQAAQNGNRAIEHLDAVRATPTVRPRDRRLRGRECRTAGMLADPSAVLPGPISGGGPPAPR